MDCFISYFLWQQASETYVCPTWDIYLFNNFVASQSSTLSQNASFLSSRVAQDANFI